MFILTITSYLAAISVVMVLVLALMSARALHVILFQKRVKAQRASENFDDFQRSFLDGSVSASILHNVYKMLSEEIAMVANLPVRDTDSLHKIYGIDGFTGINMNDLIEMLSDRCNIDVKFLEPPCPLYTVGHLVRYLNSAMQASAQQDFRPRMNLNEKAWCEPILSM